MVAADAILFAVQAGLELYGAIRKSYVDATRGRPITLPLPTTPGLNWTSARSYFNDLDPEIKQRYPEGVALASLTTMTGAQEQAIVVLYREALGLDHAASEEQIGGRDIAALMTVRQWTKGRYGPDPTALQSVAGTLVNIGVDYFLARPGAISDKKPEGRAMRKLLEVLDKEDFAAAEVSGIIPDLMVAVLDSVAANPDLFGGGKNAQLLVENITVTMAAAAREKLKDLPSEQVADASVWLQLAARSMLQGGAQTVLDNPQRFFKVKGDAVPLIQSVGAAITDLVIGEESVSLRPLLSQHGLTTIARAAVDAVAKNPGMITRNNGIQKVISGVAGAVVRMREPLPQDIFPELVRLVLEKSADNLDLIWPAKDPAKHLLVTATKTILAQLSKKPAPGQKWRPALTGDQILEAVEAVVDEVVDNPDWLVKRAGKTDPILGEVVKAVLASLRKIDGKRLSADAGVAVLRAALGAVASQIGFLRNLPGEAETAIQAALDAIFDTVFAEGADAEQHWKLAANSVVVMLVEVTLDELAELDMNAGHIAVLRGEIRAELDATSPFDPTTFAERLQAKLAAA